jgi:hypothetical protein
VRLCPRPRVGRGSAGITATKIFASGDLYSRLAHIGRITHVTIGTGKRLRRHLRGLRLAMPMVDGFAKADVARTATAAEHSKIVARLGL